MSRDKQMATLDAQQIACYLFRALSNDLRRPKYRNNPNPLAGHCYVISEAAYHLLGASESGWAPRFIHHEGEPHWFLKHRKYALILDLTVSQFRSMPDYSKAVGKGFLTGDIPSKRAKILINRVHEILRRGTVKR